MDLHIRNPAVGGRVSSDMLAGAPLGFNTLADWRTQLIASRFCLTPTMAREVSSLLFGGLEHE